MINGKKVIAVCVSIANNEENIAYLKEFHSLAEERGYLMIAYYLTSDVFQFNDSVKEDAGIFKMINYDYVDALVVVHDDIMNDGVISELVRVAKENNKPRVVIGAKCEDAYVIEYQGDDCFEAIVRHVVEEHGCRNVYFLAGNPELEISVNWVNIYKRVLEDNGIEYDESKVGYGYYWSTPTYDIVDEWIQRPQIPEAIVCSNDIMAITACKCLNEHGYYVPENIVVTGFDGIVREHYHHPRLTTGVRDEAMSCAMAIEILDDLFAGMPFNPMYVKQQYHMTLSQSCGCASVQPLSMNESSNLLYDRLSEFDSHESSIYRMAGELSGISEKEDMYRILSKYIEYNSYIAIRDKIWDIDENFGDIDYDETLTVINYYSAARTEQKKLFPLGVNISEMGTVDGQTALITVFPLRYRNQLFGYYVVFSDGNTENMYCNSRLVNMLNVTINTVLNQHKLSATNNRIAEMQTRDSLTGIYNSRGFVQEVRERYLDNPQNRSMILLALDIDRLKSINEAFGHDEGDVALIALADIIKNGASVEDVCARYGTDEFLCAVFTSEDHDYMIHSLLNNIFASVKNYNTLYDKPYTLEVNHEYIIGQPKTIEEVNQLVKTVLEKKQSRKDRRSNAEANVSVEQSEEDIRDYQQFCKLVDENLFKYAFQPIVSARSGEIYAYEALMRSSGGVELSPIRIIELAEKFDRLSDIEHATFNNVIKYMDENLELFNGRKVFVNSIISAILTREEVQEILAKYGRFAKQVVVEVTEQTSIEHETYMKVVNYLKSIGIGVAIDDYGTGYSNTSRIIDCTPDYVKIDRSLITGIHFDYRKQHFVSNIIEYAHDNGFMALAEGVENASELKAVVRMGVDLIQGYYTARPSFEVISSIDHSIKEDITRYVGRQGIIENKKTYIADTDEEINLYDMMINMYSEILVTSNNVTIVGNGTDYVPMIINFENNKDYTVTFKNAWCNHIESADTIRLGENSTATFIFEGDCRLDNGGIYVPKTSSLRLEGDGSLEIACGDEKTCIGGNNESYGNIDICMPGGLVLKVECEIGIAIGGISNSENSRITVKDTKLTVVTATTKSVGVGSLYGDAYVDVTGGCLDLTLRSRQSVGIGSVDEKAEIEIVGAEVHIENEGDMITGIGTLSSLDNKISIVNTDFHTVSRGKYINCIGSDSGEYEILLKDNSLDLYCEGSSVMCYGTRTQSASLRIENCVEKLDVRSGDPVLYSASEDKLTIIGERSHIKAR